MPKKKQGEEEWDDEEDWEEDEDWSDDEDMDTDEGEWRLFFHWGHSQVAQKLFF